jgi:hypothetical protein
MRKLWLAGVAVVALLSAGCSVGPTTATTTTSHGSATTVKGHHTSTTVKGHDTSKGNDKAACAQYVMIHNLGKAPTPAQYRTFIKDLRHAKNAELKKAAIEFAKGITTKNGHKLNSALATISKTCASLGLS